MKLCLIVANNSEHRTAMREAVENLGFIALEASDVAGAYISAYGLLPDFIILDLANTHGLNSRTFIEKLGNIKNKKKPFVMEVDGTDADAVAYGFHQENLLDIYDQSLSA